MSQPSINFGNWIRRRIVAAFLLASLVLFCASAVISIVLIRIVLLLAAVVTLLMFAYLAYVYYQFSERGGVQRQLWTLVIDHLDWERRGKVLDIGTGNGALAVLLAAKYPNAQVTGIDYWGKSWEYSQQVCEQNAAAMGVAERTHFQKASASSLPFEDDALDAAASHFVFHEVADAPDKREVIREALRVVRKGGAFAFQDMFLDAELYGDIDSLLETIRRWGIAEVHFVDSGAVLKLPRLLRHPRVLGKAALIYGHK